jgi:hypothetical protein
MQVMQIWLTVIPEGICAWRGEYIQHSVDSLCEEAGVRTHDKTKKARQKAEMLHE